MERRNNILPPLDHHRTAMTKLPFLGQKIGDIGPSPGQKVEEEMMEKPSFFARRNTRFLKRPQMSNGLQTAPQKETQAPPAPPEKVEKGGRTKAKKGRIRFNLTHSAFHFEKFEEEVESEDQKRSKVEKEKKMDEDVDDKLYFLDSEFSEEVDNEMMEKVQQKTFVSSKKKCSAAPVVESDRSETSGESSGVEEDPDSLAGIEELPRDDVSELMDEVVKNISQTSQSESPEEVEDELMEEDQEEASVSSKETDSYTSFDESDRSESSEESSPKSQTSENSGLEEEMEEKIKNKTEEDTSHLSQPEVLSSLQEKVDKLSSDLREERTKSCKLASENKSLQDELKAALNEKHLHQEHLMNEMQTLKMENANIRTEFKTMETEYERMKSERHEEMIKKDHAAEDSLCAEMQFMKAKVSDLEESQNELQYTKSKLQVTITNMTADLEEHKKVIEKLRSDLQVSTSQRREAAERDRANSDYIRSLKEQINKQQDDSWQKKNETESTFCIIKDLKSKIEAKQDMVSSLQEKVNQSVSDFNDERKKNCKLQKDYEAAVRQQQKQAETLDQLTGEIQQLASDNESLRDELEAALKEKQLVKKQLQEDAEVHRRLEEAVMKEKARFSKAYKKIQMQKEELTEKTLTLEESLATEKHLMSSLKMERERNELMVLQKLTAEDPQSDLKNQLKEASASIDRLQSHNQTLKTEKETITAKFKNMETEYEKETSEHRSLFERHQEMMSKKNETISDNQRTIAKLKDEVDKLKEQQSETETRHSKLKDKIRKDNTRNSELQHRVDQISSALKNEKITSEKYRIELKESLSKQIETLEEKQKLSVALRSAQDRYARLQEQQLAEPHSRFNHISNTEFRPHHQRTALDDTTRALHHLQREYIDLVRRHEKINSDYSELLKSHHALQMRQERLSYTQGGHDLTSVHLSNH